MPVLSELVKKLPTLKESRMVANGYCVWIAWKGDLHGAVKQTLTDYGGMCVTTQRDQALWFFFSTDVFLAMARLEIWARLNPLPVFIQIFSTKLLLGYKLEITLSLDPSFANQQAIVPDELDIWVHPKSVETAKGIPGISYTEGRKVTGMASADWMLLQADPRLPYQSSLGWYMVLKPLGNPLDKNFQAGWRAFFEPLEDILKKLKLKYLIDENFLMFPLGNLKELRDWCMEFLRLIANVKSEDSELTYWPCVMACVEKRALNFNKDLPRKISLDWEMLMPDFPHMSYRTAFLLGENFRINDVRFSVDQSSIEDWCNVSLVKGPQEDSGSMAIELPTRIIAGNNPACFYCGQRNHKLQDCPSKNLSDLNTDVWDMVSQLDLDGFNSGFRVLDERMAKAPSPEEGLATLLQGDEIENHLTRMFFEIGVPNQIRFLSVAWRTKGKDYPAALKQLAPVEEGAKLVWSALDTLMGGEEMVQADRMAAQAAMKAPRDFKPRTLQGFSAVEKGDMQRAANYWKEAEALSPSNFLKTYHLYLQARAMEVAGKYQVANSLYKQAFNTSPRWYDCLYRQGVCLVKMGFAEQAMGFFEAIIRKDPHMFNRTMVDPELERGHLQLHQSLYTLFQTAKERMDEERKEMDNLRMEVGKWFPGDHPYSVELNKRLEDLVRLNEVENYVAFHRLAIGRRKLSAEFKARIAQESRTLKQDFQEFMDRLRDIQYESSWFPFPRLLVDFNREFNFCARNVNWALRQHFTVADTFRKAQDLYVKVQENLKELEGRLKTLKIVRDSTLFIMVMGKTFFWLEMFGLLMILVFLPLTVYYGERMDYEWATGLVLKQKWEIQKGLILILSILSLTLAALRAALTFERKRRVLFKKHGIN